MQNPIFKIRSVASRYANAIQQDGSYSHSTYWSARDIHTCLTNASWGFDAYLRECSNFETVAQRYKDEGGDKIRDVATQNGKFAYYHNGLQRWMIASAYHARAIYGELWVASEKARKGNEGKPLPELQQFKPRGLTLVRNHLIVHHENPETMDTSLGAYKPYVGPTFYPDRDLDGNGTNDNGLVGNVVEFLDDLEPRMTTFVKPKKVAKTPDSTKA